MVQAMLMSSMVSGLMLFIINAINGGKPPKFIIVVVDI